jgi:endonuclease G, mitochondrial
MLVLKPWRCTLLASAFLMLTACAPSQPVPVPRQITDKTPCGNLTFAGFPMLTPEIKAPYFVCKKDTYAAEFNPTSKTPLWVVERVTGTVAAAPMAPHVADFRPDPDIPTGLRTELYDYDQQGYAIGAMATPAEFGADAVRISRTYYLSNTLPQNPSNAAGIWALLDQNVREWAAAKGELYVISGPIYPQGTVAAWIGGPPKREGGPLQRRYSQGEDQKQPYKGKMGVPAYLYKVIYDPQAHQAVAFVIPNQDVPAAMLPRYATSVALVEQYTHLRFFPDVPEAQRQGLVNLVSPQAWVLH